jgi:hypothetical protein
MRPRHDPTSGFRRPILARAALMALVRTAVKRGRRPDARGGEAGEPVPVNPNRPLDLSGGAAAALEFDD